MDWTKWLYIVSCLLGAVAGFVARGYFARSPSCPQPAPVQVTTSAPTITEVRSPCEAKVVRTRKRGVVQHEEIVVRTEPAVTTEAKPTVTVSQGEPATPIQPLPKPDYALGIDIPVLKHPTWRNVTIRADRRLFSDVWLTSSISADLSVRVGLRYEF